MASVLDSITAGACTHMDAWIQAIKTGSIGGKVQPPTDSAQPAHCVEANIKFCVARIKLSLVWDL